MLSAVPLFSCFWFSYGSADWLYFFSTLYAGGSSVSIIGSSDFAPHNPGRLLYLFDSMAGISVTPLALTYLMQIYNQLQLRNTFVLKVYLTTRSTEDAAELITGIAPRRDGATALPFSGVGSRHRGHQGSSPLYPALFYMRFSEHSYSVSYVALVLLDSVTLIRSVSSNQEDAIKELHALDQL